MQQMSWRKQKSLVFLLFKQMSFKCENSSCCLIVGDGNSRTQASGITDTSLRDAGK